MCGIFGIVIKKGSSYKPNLLNKLFKDLALISQSRGNDASGFVFRDEAANELKVTKGPVSISSLLKENAVKKNLRERVEKQFNNKFPIAIIGHARLVTNGSQLEDDDNQPIVKQGIVGVHNGIIVNEKDLWSKYKNLKKECEIDTEVMLSLVRLHLENKSSTMDAVSKSINEVFGTVSTALFFDDRDEIALATNNGSLYISTNYKDFLIFASEKHMLRSIMRKGYFRRNIKGCNLKQVTPCTGYLVGLADFSIKEFGFNKANVKMNSNKLPKRMSIKVKLVHSGAKQLPAIFDPEEIGQSPEASQEKKLLEYNIERIRKLRRCTRCVLPETFPFIEFDSKGVCNYCHEYVIKNRSKPISELKKLVAPYKSKTGEPDVLVMFSGGRDSTFMLHMIKKVLGMNPIALTYDWGMVTDLARRNIARACGKLGVENILVSADIKKKRENIRKNIKAWLRKPVLGAVPLFMAGDKYFFYYCDKIKKQTGIKMNLWGGNPLEVTLFKTGFTGVKNRVKKRLPDQITLINHMRLAKFIFTTLVSNPAYINSSVLDTFGSYIVRFIIPKRDRFKFYEYYRWDENEIESLLFKEYDWEKAKDTPTTWRIGDGTASFYNYIYFTIAGFTESDTFRSNQVREGMISREQALRIVEQEDKPRYESIKWYLNIVGLDYEDTIQKINRAKKLYK